MLEKAKVESRRYARGQKIFLTTEVGKTADLKKMFAGFLVRTRSLSTCEISDLVI